MVVETVEVCSAESKRGDPDRAGYIVVSELDLSRLSRVHSVSEIERAALALKYPDASGMDAGERDLFAHAFAREDDAWILSSPDKASIRAAVALGWSDRLCSLGALVKQTGARPHPKLKKHFEESWLIEWRTHFLLDGGLA